MAAGDATVNDTWLPIVSPDHERPYICAECGDQFTHTIFGKPPSACRKPTCRYNAKTKYGRDYYLRRRWGGTLPITVRECGWCGATMAIPPRVGKDAGIVFCECLDCRRMRQYGNTVFYLYRIRIGDYIERYRRQNGRCAACGAPPTDLFLAVDHDHSCCPGKRSCGKCLRGLLCDACNVTNGFARENNWRLLGLTAYNLRWAHVE